MTDADGTPARPLPSAGGTDDASPSPAAASALPQRFGANVIMNYVTLGVTALSAVVVTPLLLHHLGRSAFGVWVLASTVVAYLELFELGFGGATTKLIAEDAHVRPEQAIRMLNTTFFVLLPLGVIALGVGAVIAVLFPTAVHVSSVLRPQVFPVVFILGVALAVSIPGDTIGGSLIGYQRFDLLSLSNSLMVGSISLASVLIVINGGGIVPLAIASTTISVAFQFVRWAIVRHIVPGARIRPRLVDRLQLRAAANISGWFLFYAVLQATLQACDVLVVGIVLGVRPAAVYAVGAKLAKAANQGLDSLATVFFPYASATARNKEPGALKDVVVDSARVTLLVGALLTLLLVTLSGPGIRAWVGTGYDTSAHVLIILAIAVGLASPVRSLSNVLLGSGSLREVCAVSSVEVACNFVLSVTLAHVIGPIGVAVGTLGGVLLVRLPGILVIGTRVVEMRLSTLVRGAVVPHVLPAGACAAVLVVGRVPAQRSLTGLILVAAAGTLTYIGLYLATGATPGERQRARGFVSALGHRTVARALRGR